MTYIYLILALVLLGAAAVATFGRAQGRRRETVKRIESIIDYSTRVATPDVTDVSVYLDREPGGGVFAVVATWLGGIFSTRLTAFGEEAVHDQLMAAGMYTVTPRTILGYRILTTIGLPVVAALLTGLHSFLSFVIVLLTVFAGWVLPLSYVQRKARQRINALDRALPDLIDLLSVMIEAGLSFPQAMRIASERFHPPLGDELKLTLQEQTMGLGIDEALAHMAERADTVAVKTFVRAMTQGEKMGISIGQIMRNLAHEMRQRRRATAEERAQKTPVLMLFPLVFLIFPALFIVLMTPAVISLVHNLKGF
jgi:tight adherence protein C